MSASRRFVAALATTALTTGLLVFDVVALPGEESAPVAAETQTISLAAAATGSTEPDEPVLLTDTVETQDFTVLGVTWDAASADAADVQVQARVRQSDGWTDWILLGVNDSAPDDGTDEAAMARATVGTEPLITDGGDAVQLQVSTVDGTVPEGIEGVVIDPGASKVDETESDFGVISGADADLLRPSIVTRAQWGADESKRLCNPSYSSSIKAAAVHHTAGTNNYTASESAGIVRGIYAYHTGSLGWCDVGYNFLVDKFGTVYEGRSGGVERAVRGAHASGFNNETFGVAAMGNYETAAAPDVMVQAISRLVGWKMAVSGAPTTGKVTLTSAGGGTSRYAAGSVATVPRIFGHRDVGVTVCPGQNLYSKLANIRTTATPYAGYGSTGNLYTALEIDGSAGDELVRYNPATGKMTVLDLSTSGAPTPIYAAQWSRGWNIVVPVEVDKTTGSELLLYNTTSGRQSVVDLNRAGVASSVLSETQWSQWDIVKAIEVDKTSGDELLVYDTRTGRQTVVDLSVAGRASRPLSETNWSIWDTVVAVEVDGTRGSELIVYDSRTGTQNVVDLSNLGRASRALSETSWSPWDQVFAAEVDGTLRSELVTYNSLTGRQMIVDIAPNGDSAATYVR